MKRARANDRRRKGRTIPLLVLIGAIVFTAGAAWQMFAILQRLPVAQISRLDQGTILQRAWRTALSEGLRGATLVSGSIQVRQAVLDPEPTDSTDARAKVGLAASRLRGTKLGRLQQAALVMRNLERAGLPRDEWWATLEPYFHALDDVSFAHYQGEFVRHVAQTYESAGAEAGTARAHAARLYEQPHGPFLQYFVRQMRRLADERDAAGEAETASLCRRIARRLLREWVLDRGAPFTRLLAADLLADALNADSKSTSAPANVEETAAIARDLRAWRSAYRDNAASRPPSILRVTRQAELCPTEQERLVDRLALTTWVGAAAISVGVAALFIGWVWVRRGTTATRTRGAFLRAAAAATLVIVAGLLWIQLSPESVREDFRRNWSDSGEIWRHPLVSGGISLALVAALGLIPFAGRGQRTGSLERLAAATTAAWLLLSATLLFCGWSAEAARSAYERSTAAALEDRIGTIAGKEADRLLNKLRAWKP